MKAQHCLGDHVFLKLQLIEICGIWIKNVYYCLVITVLCITVDHVLLCYVKYSKQFTFWVLCIHLLSLHITTAGPYTSKYGHNIKPFPAIHKRNASMFEGEQSGDFGKEMCFESYALKMFSSMERQMFGYGAQ
jgi:hypothetical protein